MLAVSKVSFHSNFQKANGRNDRNSAQLDGKERVPFLTVTKRVNFNQIQIESNARVQSARKIVSWQKLVLGHTSVRALQPLLWGLSPCHPDTRVAFWWPFNCATVNWSDRSGTNQVDTGVAVILAQCPADMTNYREGELLTHCTSTRTNLHGIAHTRPLVGVYHTTTRARLSRE